MEKAQEQEPLINVRPAPPIKIGRRTFLAGLGAAGTVALLGTDTPVVSSKSPAATPAPEDFRETLHRDFVLQDALVKNEPLVFTGSDKKEHRYQCVGSLHDSPTDAQVFAVREIISADPHPQASRGSLKRFGQDIEQNIKDLGEGISKQFPHKGKSKPSSALSEQPVFGSELLVFCPGRSDSHGTPTENAIVKAMIDGERSKQTIPVGDYVSGMIIPDLLTPHPEIASVHIFGHSMGAGNALTAKHLIDGYAASASHRLAVDATLFEPLAATQAAGFIAWDPVDNPGANEQKAAAIVNALRANITSVRVNPPTYVMEMPIGKSEVGSKPFGAESFDVNVPTSPYSMARLARDAGGAKIGATAGALPWLARFIRLKPPDKGTLIKSGGMAAIGSTIGTAVNSEYNNEKMHATYHEIAACIPLLSHGDAETLTQSEAGILATTEQVLHPERFPAPARTPTEEEINKSYIDANGKGSRGNSLT
jgi:hypothetical protein